MRKNHIFWQHSLNMAGGQQQVDWIAVSAGICEEGLQRGVVF